MGNRPPGIEFDSQERLGFARFLLTKERKWTLWFVAFTLVLWSILLFAGDLQNVAKGGLILIFCVCGPFGFLIEMYLRYRRWLVGGISSDVEDNT